MSLRPLLAGPSVRSTHLRTFARNLTIPHPDLTPAPGTSTYFLIRTAKRPDSLPHIYAVVRAAEKALGSSIISVDVKRDDDTLQPYTFIHVETLYPVAHDKTVHLSIAAPQTQSDINGGPSLDEVRSALRDEPRQATGGEKEFAFKIEKAEPRETKTRYKSGVHRTRLTKGTAPTIDVLNALERMGGKWGEIAQKWAHLRDSQEARWTPREDRGRSEHASGRHAGGLDGDKTQVDGVERAEAKAERRESKHRRHDSDQRRMARDDEDDPIGRARRRSEETRGLRHRQRAEEATGRGVKEQESDWKFDLDRPAAPTDTEVNIDALKLHPEPPATAPDSETGAASLSSLESKPRPRGFSVRRKVSPATPEPTSTSSPAAAQIPDSTPTPPEAAAVASPSPSATVQDERAAAAVAKAKAKELAETQRVMDQLRRDAQAREARRAAEADRAAREQAEREGNERLAKEEARSDAQAERKRREAEREAANDPLERARQDEERRGPEPEPEAMPKSGFFGRFFPKI